MAPGSKKFFPLNFLNKKIKFVASSLKYVYKYIYSNDSEKKDLVEAPCTMLYKSPNSGVFVTLDTCQENYDEDTFLQFESRSF